MLKLKNFPAEVVTNIIRQLNRQDISKCLIVNKLFYKCAIKEFYKSLVLDVDHTEAFVDYLDLEEIERDKNFDNHKHLVTHLKFRDYWNVLRLGFKRHFIMSFEVFTSLTFIDISSSLGVDSILEYLIYCEKTVLPNLQRLEVFNETHSLYSKSNHSIKNLYLCVCYRHRRSLTHLEIFDPYLTYSLEQTGYNETHLNLLPSFENLKNLNIHYRYDDKQVYRLLASSILYACPDLTHFKIVCDYHFLKPSDLKRSSPKIRNEKCSTNSSGISRLKYVSLDIRTMNTICMENILSNISISQLNRFTLNLTCGHQMNQWIRSIDIKTLKKFLQHLKSAKESILYAQHIDTLTNLEILQEGLYAMHKIWAVSNTLKTEKQEKNSKIFLQVEFKFGKKELDLSFALDLKNKTLQGYQKIGDRFFYSVAYSYLLLAPFYDTVFREDIEELRIKVFTFEAHERTHFLLNKFSQVKKLQINLADEPKDWKLIMCRKPMIKVPNHLQIQGTHPIKNHYSPVDVETHYAFLREECYIYGSQSNLVADSYKITGIPISNDTFNKLRLTPNIRFRHLTLDFKFLLSIKRIMLILIQFLNTKTEIAYNFMVFADLENQTVTHVPGIYRLENCSKSLQGGIIEIFSEGFDEISIGNNGDIVYNKIFNEQEKVKGPHTWRFG